MKPEKVHFWAKTTADGKPGISVRDHCLNVGCVAEEPAPRRPPKRPRSFPFSKPWKGEAYQPRASEERAPPWVTPPTIVLPLSHPMGEGRG
jgi:hypothetical protein